MTRQDTGACVYVGLAAPGPDGKLREIRRSIAVTATELADKDNGDPVVRALTAAYDEVRAQWERPGGR